MIASSARMRRRTEFGLWLSRGQPAHPSLRSLNLWLHPDTTLHRAHPSASLTHCSSDSMRRRIQCPVTVTPTCRSPFCMGERRTEVRKQPSTRIVVVGAGYAGLLSAMRLAGRVAGHDIAITLVNESDTFTERVRLHQFATNRPVQWRSLPR